MPASKRTPRSISSISVVTCGQCNAEINVPFFLKFLKRAIQNQHHIPVHIGSQKGSQLVVIANGCRVGCVKRSNYPQIFSTVLVSGTAVDAIETHDEKSMLQTVLQKIDSKIEGIR